MFFSRSATARTGGRSPGRRPGVWCTRSRRRCWSEVHVGALRPRAITALSPVAQDVVIAGHDRDYASFLIFPNLAGCRSLCPDLGEAPIRVLIEDPRVRERVREAMASLRSEGGGSSTYAARAVLLEEPPLIDAGEITDKGYINQRAVLDRRAAIVERLYAEPSDAAVIGISNAG